ncbi:hypothetical protein SM11_chr2319 [Sinorhizobium meliloti SM11]|uniref:Tail assembly chaperone n=1 Tax=Sinorhizobium meliloti (strain SM11) TaxID=707241 RepID=F7X315_SINMM|nr:hypothetical protein [Sinorhizobium meliloti]AEH79573.1 hypothetical protein SM11_chr2319 [Sinorhizobium meliloti SM11]MDE4557575.1 hypothetical protein [Sinorhizobium meliloti SM11]
MTYQRPAYEQVTIAHGKNNTVTLRPSLRAAATLVDRHGFPALYRALDELNLTIISEIILTASEYRQDAAAFLSVLPGRPLFPFLLAVRQPLAELVSMFQPAPDPKAKPSTGKGKAMTWAELYAALYDHATGWLNWTPETAWNATPTEIDRAYNAHIDKLKAIHGSADDKPTGDKQPDPEQAARNVAEGLDPEFDRAGLRALKAKIAGGA